MEFSREESQTLGSVNFILFIPNDNPDKYVSPVGAV